MAVNLIILMVAIAAFCSAQDVTISFNNYQICDKTHYLKGGNQVTVEAGSSASSSSLSSCDVTFIADTEDGTDGQRLCFYFETMDFLNNKLELLVHGQQPNTVLKTYNSDTESTLQFQPPFEYCPEDSEVALRLQSRAPASGTANDIRLKILVRHIKSNRRIVYLDSGCGQTHFLLGSTVSVLSREEGSTEPARTPCSKTFTYIGTKSNMTACLQFDPKPNCKPFSLRVFDGTDEEGLSELASYSCSTTGQHSFCAMRKSIKLELSGNRDQETESLFNIWIKDGPKGGSFPEPADKNGGLPLWAKVVIGVGAVVAVAVIAILVYCCCCKSKGRRSVDVKMRNV